jgi:bis(5'-nucleosidyl)-tetraphosphatase
MSLMACGVLLVVGKPVEKFLLMVHADRYDLPKGHREPGETELGCALREMEEETGIERQLVTIDPKFRHESNYTVCSARTGHQPVAKKTVIFLGYLGTEPQIRLSEHLGYRWFAWQPPHAIQAQAIDPLLQHLEAFLRGPG